MGTCSAVSKCQLLFKEKTQVMVLRAKDVKDHPKPATVMIWGCIGVRGMDDLHMFESTTDAEEYIGNLERHMPIIKATSFSEICGYFSRKSFRAHSVQLTTERLHRHTVCVLDWQPRSASY